MNTKYYCNYNHYYTTFEFYFV